MWKYINDSIVTDRFCTECGVMTPHRAFPCFIRPWECSHDEAYYCLVCGGSDVGASIHLSREEYEALPPYEGDDE